MPVDKVRLLKSRLPEAEVEIPGVGTVRVRGLARAEVLDVRDLRGAEFERRLIAIALVDPELTDDEAYEWQQAAVVGEFEPVVAKVMELSGLATGAGKEAYKELASDPDAEFRDVPGVATEDDGGPAPGGDV